MVGFSNRQAGHDMTARLIDWGYRNIAFLGSADEARSMARRQGYEACLSAHGRPAHAVGVPMRRQAMAAAAEAFLDLLETRPETDAVFFSHDMAAAAAVMACQRRGIPVPDRVAIAGFGDFEIADQLVPRLTTVRVPRYRIGAEAARLIVDRLNGADASPRVRDLGFEIIRRESA
jgi:LacI family gluconate utilization system Gnt-I transcriptional repressor